LTPTQFKTIRHKLGLSISQMADAIGVDERTIRRYESGDREIGKPVQILLEYIIRHGIISSHGHSAIHPQDTRRVDKSNDCDALIAGRTHTSKV
jgi:predicted transcriptional regulator